MQPLDLSDSQVTSVSRRARPCYTRKAPVEVATVTSERTLPHGHEKSYADSVALGAAVLPANSDAESAAGYAHPRGSGAFGLQEERQQTYENFQPLVGFRIVSRIMYIRLPLVKSRNLRATSSPGQDNNKQQQATPSLLSLDLSIHNTLRPTVSTIL